MNDLITVVWKEWKSIFRTKERRTQSLMLIILPICIFGVAVPWMYAHEWLEAYHPVLASAAIPVLLILMLAPDSFAGERERHTLPTLLASRLPDKAILWGKVIWNSVFAWGFVVAILMLGLTTANITIAEGFSFYSMRVLFSSLGLGMLMTLMAVGIIIPISLRSSTVQEAIQTTSMFLIGMPTVAIVALVVLKKVDPEYSIEVWMAREDPYTLLGLAMIALTGIDAILLLYANRSFRRARLIAK